MNENVLVVSQLTKVFKNGNGIFNINFEIPKKSLVVLMGPNGSGKTTLIRTILRLYQEYDGEVTINGKNNENPNSLKDVSYIGESAIFPQGFNLKEYLSQVAYLKHIPKNKVASIVNGLVKKFNMVKHLKNKPNTFSSGEKQKVMLMKVIIEDSWLIIMDEPTANLDPEARINFFDAIEDFNKQGKSVLICSHNLDELDGKATHALLIHDGQQKYFSPVKKSQKLKKLFMDNK